MKAREFNVRPSSGFNTAFSVYWHFEINHAREIFSGTKEECYEHLNTIETTLQNIQDTVKKTFTEELFNKLNNELYTIGKINIGGLMFELVSRDFDDGQGNEVNCECFILNKGTYGVTEKDRDGVDGIPYDDEFCTNWFIKDYQDYEKTYKYILDEICEFVILDNEMLKYANQQLTWNGIKGER